MQCPNTRPADYRLVDTNKKALTAGARFPDSQVYSHIKYLGIYGLSLLITGCENLLPSFFTHLNPTSQ
jgi:hypothetical protein